jgi:tRNA A37 methylthiotransferase MiaB
MNAQFIVIGDNCPRRLVDAQTIKNYFLANELSWTDDVALADFISVVTCGAFNSPEKASIRTINNVNEKKKKKL